MRSPLKPEDDKAIMRELLDPQLADHPDKWILFALPWGKPNTPLHDKKGPRNWQREEFEAIGDHIKNNRLRMELGLNPLVYQSAIVSGRGPGKSAFFSMFTLWIQSVAIGGTTLVTANTEPQLKTKTWAELGKWATLLQHNAHWFEMNALSLRPQEWFKAEVERELSINCKYYAANALLWSEENPDAFAGAHNENGMSVVFDEASGIHEKIWTVSEGFFTEKSLHRYWLVFSNPRRNTGAFYECFNKHRDFWRRRQIDSRTVEGVDVDRLNSIVQKYGPDSDEAKIEVYGQFPSQGDKQFISRDVVEDARERNLEKDSHAPLIMGVDPARFGDDKSVIRFRQGRNGRVIPAFKMRGLDNMELANHCAFLIHKYNPDAVCIDAGNGTGVIDRLREMGYKITEVWFGKKATEKEWSNYRTELWAKMREWLKGACIDSDLDLKDDLVGPEYLFVGRSDQIMLEQKEKMKARGLHSPDDADALACTFAANPARRDLRAFKGSNRNRIAKDVDYKIFGS